jgi:hypothetical protein
MDRDVWSALTFYVTSRWPFCAKEVGVIFQFGRLVLLQLLAPRVRRYFPADVLAMLEPPPPTVDGMRS